MKRSVFLLIAVITAFLLSGCRFVRIEDEERKPVAYTVVEKSDIPEELSRIMEEKKEKEFQLSYETGEDLYLAKGYGRQMSGGYSIQVEELGESGNGLFFCYKTSWPGRSERSRSTIVSLYCDKNLKAEKTGNVHRGKRQVKKF